MTDQARRRHLLRTLQWFPLKFALVALVLACSTGCGDRINVSRRHGLTCPTRITVKGDTVALDWGAEPTNIKVSEAPHKSSPRGGQTAGRPDGVEVEVFGPDGWVEAVPYTHPDRQKELDISYEGGVAALLVDNRAGPPCQVTVGEVVLSIGENATPRFGFPAPRTAETSTVNLDGKNIGTLEQGSDRTYLIDVTGKRNYRARWIQYGGMFAFKLPEPRRFSSGRLHVVGDRITYFLVPVPKSLKTREAAPGVVFDQIQGELVESTPSP
jgi:hypothetical protein